MDKSRKFMAVILALLAAIFYAINTPFSKVLLNEIPSTLMASFLYLGAGMGVGIRYLFRNKDENKYEKLNKGDLSYTIGMIVLDIAAPIFLMIGINIGSASNASLLGNFEIVATTIIALLIFKEKVTSKLWIAIGFITVSSIVLSVERADSFQFSLGSLFVILATCCWGLENNCTRELSSKSTYQIVMLKGLCSGLGALVISLIKKESFPGFGYIAIALALGFVAYGLSIFMYVRAQNVLGAAKTSAYYAVNPLIGALLAFVFLSESLSWMYVIALIVMVIGSALVVVDTFIRQHDHEHQHTFTHSHGGSTHTHTVRHSHVHKHYLTEEKHRHRHSIEELENLGKEKDR